MPSGRRVLHLFSMYMFLVQAVHDRYIINTSKVQANLIMIWICVIKVVTDVPADSKFKQ